MFRRLESAGEADVEFTFDGRAIAARSGETVAAALLAAGVLSFRATRLSSAGRGPYCMMGACYECLVAIDGETVQACSVAVSPGLRVERPEPTGATDGGKP